MHKKILGLDLGTNSIGWALVEQNFEEKYGKILGMGSRIIPMSQDILGEFGKGNSVSQTAERTRLRSIRRLRERHLLRRERLHRVLHVLGFLPEHYAAAIDFTNRPGKFLSGTEPKIAYKKTRNAATNNEEFAFLFAASFEEMLTDFKTFSPLKKDTGEDLRVPYDWTIYYLRKKALTQKIEKEELAWLLLHFNQKRGYYQLRGEEEEEKPNKLAEFYSLKIVDVLADESQKKGETWYSLILENGWVYRRSSKTPLFDWKGKVRDFIVTTELNDDGSEKKDKEGNVRRSFRAPGEDDWTLLKKKTEQDIDRSKKTVGTYIYDSLVQNPRQKIKGALVRTIERKFYKDELKQILESQKRFHRELQDEGLYFDAVRELYRNNEAHQQILGRKDFTHLFIEDILFYQRPLKSKKSAIGNCPLEYKTYKDTNGNEHKVFLKTIPKSHPLYQEFRLWQWIFNLNIYTKEDDANCTSQFLNSREDYENVFAYLNTIKEIKQDTLIKHLLEQKGLKGKILNTEVTKYRWNYVQDKTYPCNETRAQISSRLSKVANLPTGFLTETAAQQLWHIIYSVTDKTAFEKALKSFAVKHALDELSFVDAFKKMPPFKAEYGAYSEKAIKKLLPLMRLGKYWHWESIDKKTQDRINKLLTGEFDETIKNRVREKISEKQFDTPADFQGLPEWLAKYVVYDRHAESSSYSKWNSVEELDSYLKTFRQHSLRNPIVEQVVTETLRVVRDIWQQYGNSAQDFFDEIHIELGRELKNTAEERKKITNQVTENENTNLRIKALLAEMLTDSTVENVIPYSPMQQEALKIYEDGVLHSGIEIPVDIEKISKMAQPSSGELQRYKLWLEQKYRSPYTGQIIPLNKLFTADYEIEHIIPQSRFFDDSFSNKIICESAVNKLKDNQTGLEFIKNHRGQKVETGFGKTATIFSEEEYREFVKQHYAQNRSKRNKLLLEDIPEKMIERQINDTRYISRFLSSALSNLVREEQNDDGVNSKNVIPANGKITAILRQDWGLNDVWNELIFPRFERLNQLTNNTVFTAYSEKQQKYLPVVPIELSKDFQKKRIDHRHHALDALVIACATRDHINLLNNLYAKSSKRYDLQRKLRVFEPVSYTDRRTNQTITKEVPKAFLKPWDTFTVDAKNTLTNIVISFKQNLRVINKTGNKYEKWIDQNGVKVKGLVTQTKGDSWAIRKSMHKDTVSGKIELPRIKVPKGKILTATRKSIDPSFDLKTIESITDTGIQKILKNYLASKENDPARAFSAEGLEDMNKNIEKYNDGKPHQPIYKARVFEIGSKFPLGQQGNKPAKYVEAAKGTNLFFAIYQDLKGTRSYESIPLNIVIERQKQGLTSVPEVNDAGNRLLLYLSPNDLVYVPTEEEIAGNHPIHLNNISTDQIKRIYKMVSASGPQCFFIRHEVAASIINKTEFTTSNKMEKSIDGIMIKEHCIKLKVDRLGNIQKI